jgi:hypothetical protein
MYFLRTSCVACRPLFAVYLSLPLCVAFSCCCDMYCCPFGLWAKPAHHRYRSRFCGTRLVVAELEVMPMVGLRGSINALATVALTQLRIEPFCEMVEWVTCQLTRPDLRTPTMYTLYVHVSTGNSFSNKTNLEQYHPIMYGHSLISRVATSSS